MNKEPRDSRDLRSILDRLGDDSNTLARDDVRLALSSFAASAEIVKIATLERIANALEEQNRNRRYTGGTR